MEFDFEELYFMMEESCKEHCQFLEFELSKIQSGGANPALLKGVKVLYYGDLVSLETICSISVPEPMQLLVKPFDLSSVKDVYAALMKSGLDIQPQNEGDKIRIPFQPITTQRKKELMKKVKQLQEETKIRIRKERQSSNSQLDKESKTLSEDSIRVAKEQVQKLTDKYNKIVDEIIDKKEEALMKV